MIDRRDMLAGMACAGAFVAAEALKPRSVLTLMPQRESLDDVVPRRIEGFREGGSGSLVLPPRTENSLASRLYSDQVGRVYQPVDDPRATIMLLVAYGAAQTDTLQLHRPESCYPAFGFTILDRRPIDMPIRSFGTLPAVALTARAGERAEDVVYWTRIGRDLPRTSGEQRRVKLLSAIRGSIGDGVLVRASAIRIDGKSMQALLSRFLDAFVLAMTPEERIALLGR